MNRPAWVFAPLLAAGFLPVILNPQVSAAAGIAPQLSIDVNVTDKSGAPITGLTASDFFLSDNKLNRQIHQLRELRDKAGAPVEAVIVLDEVNDSFTNVAFERSQLTKLFESFDGQMPVPVSLYFFTDTGAKVSGQGTRDAKMLVQQLQAERDSLRVLRRSQGIYGAVERLQMSIQGLEAVTAYETSRPGRKLVIWISPGWPLLDLPNQNLTNETHRQIFQTAVDLSTRLRRAQITLDSVDPLGTADSGTFRTFLYKQFVKGVKNPSTSQFGDLGLQVLAEQSGGQVLHSNNDIKSEVVSCLKDASDYYQMTFEAAAADGPDEYHAIELKVERQNAKVRTRAGYYAQPEMGHSH